MREQFRSGLAAEIRLVERPQGAPWPVLLESLVLRVRVVVVRELAGKGERAVQLRVGLKRCVVGTMRQAAYQVPRAQPNTCGDVSKHIATVRSNRVQAWKLTTGDCALTVPPLTPALRLVGLSCRAMLGTRERAGSVGG